MITPLYRDIRLETDAGDLIVLGRKYLGASWQKSYLKWKYLDNPAGKAISSCAEVDGKQVGFYSDIPIKLKIGKQIDLGAQAVDGVVDPEFRRHKLFLSMANNNYRQLDQIGCKLDYAFPNPTSEAGFINRLGWQAVGQVPRFVKVLNRKSVINSEHARGVKRVLAFAFTVLATKKKMNQLLPDGLLVRELQYFDQRVDELWQKASANFPIAVERNAVYLNWRYMQNPLDFYTILIAERHEKIAGLAVISYRDLSAKKFAAIAELMITPGDKAAGISLILKAENLARMKDCNQLQCWMLPQHSFYIDLLQQCGFVYWDQPFVPRIFRYTTPFVIRAHPEINTEPEPNRLSNWFLTMGDHDYY
jgi:hypothetical protein